MELSNDWHKRTNKRLFDILGDILKDSQPPRPTLPPKPGLPQRSGVPSRPSHGYAIAEKAPEIVTAPGAYFPAKKGEVIPLVPRQAGGNVDPNLFQNKMTFEGMGSMDDAQSRRIQSITQDIERNRNIPTPPPPVAPVTPPPPVSQPVASPPVTPQAAPAQPLTWYQQRTQANLPENKPLNSYSPQQFVMQAPKQFKYKSGGSGFESDQRAAYDKQNKPYFDMINRIGQPQADTPLIPRQAGGGVDPSIPEGELNRLKALAAQQNRQNVAPSVPEPTEADRFLQRPTPTTENTALPKEALSSHYPAPRGRRWYIEARDPNGMREATYQGSRTLPTPTTENTALPRIDVTELERRVKALPQGATGNWGETGEQEMLSSHAPMEVRDPNGMREATYQGSRTLPAPTTASSEKIFDRGTGIEDWSIKKEVLPSGKTQYTIPGTQGTATVSPEEGKPPPGKPLGGYAPKIEGGTLSVIPTRETGASDTGQPAASRKAWDFPEYYDKISADRAKWTAPGYYEKALAERRAQPGGENVIGITPGYEQAERERYLAENPEAREKKYREAMVEQAREANKPMMDAYMKMIEQNQNIINGNYGNVMMSKRAKREARNAAIGNVAHLQDGLAQLMSGNTGMASGMYGADSRVEASEARGARGAGRNEWVDWGHGQKMNTRTGQVAGIPVKPDEKSPTELGLIQEASKVGPDGKPTEGAKEAQRVLDKQKQHKIDIASRGIIPMIGDIGRAVPGEKNEKALEGLDQGAQEMVRKIVNYDWKLPSGNVLREPYWQNILSRAASYDPSFSEREFDVRKKLRIDFTSGNASKNIRSLNTAVYHINTLKRAAKDLNNAPVQLWNKIANASLNAVGDPRVVAFNNAATAVAGELANVFKNTTGTDQEIKAWRENQNSSQSPKQINAGIDTVIELLGGRVGSVRSQYETGMGKPKDFRFFSPESRKILEGIGIDVNTLDPVGGTSMGGNKPAIESLGGNPQEKQGNVQETPIEKIWKKNPDGVWVQE